MWRNVFAVLAGIFAMMIILTAVNIANVKLYPLPAGVDLADPVQVQRIADAMPFANRALIVASWCLGAFAGAGVAARIAASHRLWLAMLIGAVVAAGTVAKAIAIPHPDWMTVAGVLGPLFMAWIAQRLAITPEPVLPGD